MKLSPRKLLSLLIIVLAIASVPLSAQTTATDGGPGPQITSPKIPPPEFGTFSRIDYVTGAMEFTPRDSAAYLPLTAATGAQYTARTAGAYYDAAVHLPTGASIVGIEIQGCKNSVATQMTAVIAICDASGGACGIGGTVSSTGGITGCGFFSNLAVTPFTINNNLDTYLIEITLSDTANSFSGVRIYYKLQVSTPPGIATFADVPTTHAFFKFVEALYASGITGGCGGTPPNYCPDAPVTRGQMAVFLSAALGLHFPD